jgi:hypothetical protein
VPFIILLIVMIPLTVLLVGTSLGVLGAIPPLVVGAAPFYARLVEAALREVDRTTIEAVQAMGATTRQIVIGALDPRGAAGHHFRRDGDGGRARLVHRDGRRGRRRAGSAISRSASAISVSRPT